MNVIFLFSLLYDDISNCVLQCVYLLGSVTRNQVTRTLQWYAASSVHEVSVSQVTRLFSVLCTYFLFVCCFCPLKNYCLGDHRVSD